VEYHGGAIWGLDPSTKTGVACGRPGTTPVLTTVELQHEFDTYVDVFARAVKWFSGKLDEGLPELVVIEGLVPAQNHSNAMIAYGLHAVFAGLANSRGVLVRFAPVSTWRSYFLGMGRIGGDKAKAQAVMLCKQLGWDAPDHNAAEAAGIWLYGCSLVAPQITRRHEPLFARLGK